MQHRPSTAERAVHLVERVAAVLLGLVTVLIFVSAIGRYVFARPIPDAFDLSRLTLAVAVAWGFASLGFRGSHIKVDILAELAGRGLRRVMDIIAWSCLLIFTVLVTWKIGGRVLSQFPGGESTMDLRLPHWPFLGMIVLGLAAAIFTTTLRIWRIAADSEGLDSHEQAPEADHHE